MTLLDVTSVHKRFGALAALTDATLRVEDHEIVGLIGPNGSGKSTLLHAICGRTRVDGGTIRLHGKDVTRQPPAIRARAGMAIKFQLARIYPSMSVRDNLELALHAGASLPSLLAPRGLKDHEQRRLELMAAFNLSEHEKSLAGSLSHGEQQWLEIAMAMARRPSLLLLDEPTSGMGPGERQKTGVLIRAAARTCGVLVVEHDLGFVRALCDRITVLHQGVVIASGSPGEIERDPRVKGVFDARV